MAIAKTIEVIEEIDASFLTSHLAGLKKNTRNAVINNVRILYGFFNKSLGEITPREALAYAKYVDTLSLLKSSKEQYLSTARGLVEAYLNWDALERDLAETKRNPFAVTRSFVFKNDAAENRSLAADASKEEKKVKCVGQIKQFLQKCHQMSKGGSGPIERAIFHIALLQVFDAPRISENVSTFIENINPAQRIWKSGLEEGGEKTGEVWNVLPDVVSAYFDDLIRDLKARGQAYLFPGYKGQHVCANSVCAKFAELGINTHAFRHTMETLQRLHGVSLDDIEYLSNHTQPRTVAQRYIHFKPADRVALYDKCLPPEYKEILDWLETL